MPEVAAKICGLTTLATVNTAVDAGAKYTGFVFYPSSPRHITPTKAADIARDIPPSVKTVAVVVDADNEELSSIVTAFQPDFLQLHGNESPARIKEIKATFGMGIIKALKIRNSDDVARTDQYEDLVDMLLFDARAPEACSSLPGGNGLTFDWRLLQGRQFSIPWVLSGGLNASNIGNAVKTSGAQIVDVSSGLEVSPGVKDPALIKKFMQAIANT